MRLLLRQLQTPGTFYYLVANMARGIWGQPDAHSPRPTNVTDK